MARAKKHGSGGTNLMGPQKAASRSFCSKHLKHHRRIEAKPFDVCQQSTVKSLIDLFFFGKFTKDFLFRIGDSSHPDFRFEAAHFLVDFFCLPSWVLDQIPRTGFLDQIQELLEKTMKKNILQRKVPGNLFYVEKNWVKFCEG